MEIWADLDITPEREEKLQRLFVTSTSGYLLATKRPNKTKVNCSFPNTLIQAVALT